MTFRHIAPAGAPIRPGDLARWMRQMLSGKDSVTSLRRALAERVGAVDIHLVSSGRAALTVILRALAKLVPQHRTEVIVPAYTCYSVAASVLKAGLRLRIIDIVPNTLDYDQHELDRVDTSRTMAIVATNLFGFPNDMPWLSAWARTRDVFLIDDAAQAFGGDVAGSPSGTWGAAGLYSFDKGKNLPAINGGAIVSMLDVVAWAVSEELRTLPTSSGRSVAIDLVKLGVYATFLHPRLYWIPNGIPQLRLGQTEYTTSFPLETSNPTFAALALTMLTRLDDFTRHRRSNAALLSAALQNVAGLDQVRPIRLANPAYLRFPILASCRGQRDRMLMALNRVGIGATASYPASLVDVPELQSDLVEPSEISGGRAVAERILTLPTHPYVTKEDVENLAAVVRSVPASTPNQQGDPMKAFSPDLRRSP